MLVISEDFRIRKEGESYILEEYDKGGKSYTNKQGKKQLSNAKWVFIGYYSDVASALTKYLKVYKKEYAESSTVYDISMYIKELFAEQDRVQDLYDIYRG